MKHFLYRAHLLNVDTAAGAAVTAWFVATVLHVEQSSLPVLVLFNSVLIIYNFDHLSDARLIKGKACSARHRFYQRYFSKLIWWQIILVVSLGVLITQLSTNMLLAGSVLGVSVVVYFLLLRLLPTHYIIFKEFIVAIIYSLAIFTVAVNALTIVYPLNTILLLIQVFGLAFSNLLIFSYYEISLDTNEDHASLVRIIGLKYSKAIIFISLSLVIISFLFYMYFFKNLWAQSIIISMASLLAILTLYPALFATKERFRMLGDLVFLLPLVYLIYDEWI